MKNLYGENREIKGKYDKKLAVTCHNGIFVGNKTENVISYKGIPYAKKPTGELRWKDPVLAEKDDRVYEAYYFGHSPIQTEWESEPGSYYPQNEDCLKLNVWVNSENNAKNKTVMVFIHGGSYGWGATSDPIYDGYNLISKYSDVILVTIEFRLGILGFIDFSSVPGGDDYKTSGNLGLLDQICALKWIKKNISKFGGDPNNITLFGESSGAGSISLLPLIEGTDHLFHRIIAQSGSINLTYSKKECEKLTKKLLKASHATSMKDLVAISEEDIIKLNKGLNDNNNFPERDGVVLPEDLYKAYASGKTKKIDMLIGSNKDEVRYWINEMGYYTDLFSGKFIYTHCLPILYENNLKSMSDTDKGHAEKFIKRIKDKKVWRITEFYNELIFRIPMVKQAELHSSSGGKSFVYHWKFSGEDSLLGACHAIELAYVFNNLDERIYTGNKISVHLANQVQDMWINFARNGKPYSKWESYNNKTCQTMILDGGDNKIVMESDYKREERQLIEPLLKYYFNGNYSQLSLKVSQFYKIIAQCVATLFLFIIVVGGLLYTMIKYIDHKMYTHNYFIELEEDDVYDV
ncbi:alpha/beta-hydrolase [Piromyces finnis]|uniref:Carboxylic ester hydrolase n=1 Tax=Piromyces finnis TaxID=1754191 RepID=A0A1Y1UXD7_9FUNG|nr:alpha/beta-hydrolase [Piromyces finnis]|eukprot:ORX42183.1 alpha/beta-hydrolase [Piromyces finnis]